ncbi:hypothetical protein [Subtercola boreus]|uniref:ATP/GTP-binding protein n=1 Tax=Subtercola boreus TaxID=120213 RepID=A0A3E0WDW1_9MICO|nr:hypothetical protein [Subtercola boreus]RFA22039.1 hypothetical protein B7R24_04960 [Subtercola boreus]RFA22219.1 hypothetical protein B7R23_04905 [Subtercola boreus]RFA28082.1 hypothetical protein B7R25_05030 [Subtercola boreus]
MPRSNRPRRRVGPADEDSRADIERMMTGSRTVERRRGHDWNVQPLSAGQATKDYVCPGCSLPITAGTAHLVAWRADGVLGDASDLAARRHWHAHCWRIGAS